MPQQVQKQLEGIATIRLPAPISAPFRLGPRGSRVCIVPICEEKPSDDLDHIRTSVKGVLNRSADALSKGLKQDKPI